MNEHGVSTAVVEDQKWLQSASKTKSDEEMYDQLLQETDSFRWHTPHGLYFNQYQAINTIKPTFKNIKQEVLCNDFYTLTQDAWNQILRRSSIFFRSFARMRIKTKSNGHYHDQISGKIVNWKKDTHINMRELVIIKLFDDTDKLAHELLKCFSFQPNKNESMKTLIKRLSQFFHWRTELQIVLKKFGEPISDMTLYYGLNKKCILQPNANNSAFHGILTVSQSYIVAQMFSSVNKGMILTIESRYPKLQHCYSFDASLINDFPEQH
eukprot:87028_1